ncbi:MAG TPA: hypothetical protein VK666_30475 [Chryseolinea sp.]|nr:hypothetical protein [Chryseolinea sp.]
MKTNIWKYLASTTLLLFSSAPFLSLPGAIRHKNAYIVSQQSFTLQTLTVYNPAVAQCDADPFVTASNKRIDQDKLRKGNIRWMAMSRDLLKRWGGALDYGDTVFLHAGDSSIDGRWIIQDTMHKRFISHGDLLFDSATRSKGKWTNVTVTTKDKLMLAYNLK